jgi:pimeloyl-ACP methyl ester carboxylesterase
MQKPSSIWARYALCVFTTALLISSVVAQQPSDKDRPKPPGQLVDAGGHLLHINCLGEGSPTVLMESGAGDFSFDWALVHAAAAKQSRVCSYDRAGYAWSEPGPTPRTMQQISAELHTALLNAKIEGPYVLVGQSLGGLIVRTYASQYPKEMAGMVLVDSSHEDMLISLTDRTTGKENIVRFRELSRGREIPTVKAMMSGNSSKPPQAQPSSAQSKLDPPYDKLPTSLQQVRLWATSQPNYSLARSSEFDFLPEEMARMYSERSKSKYPLGNIHLVVLTRSKSQVPVAEAPAKETRSESHDRLQSDLANLSTNGKQIISKNGGHHLQLDDPELVIDAITQTIKAIRQHSRRTK